MIERIQQAESAIKAGDTRTAFEILRQVLKENPNSERAWWVMSGLVPREQRTHCLEQVLRINPQNQFARETLSEIAQREGRKPTRATSPQSAADPAKDPAAEGDSHANDYQAWHTTRKNDVFLTILAKQGLIYAVTEASLLPRVQAAIDVGKLPDALVKEKNPIPYQRVTRVRQIMSSLRIFFQIANKEDSLRIELADTAAADEVLAALQEKLDPEFVLTQGPRGRGSALLISLILLLGSASITALLLWGAFAVQAGRAGATGSNQARSIIALLDFLGPLGVGVIGGALILISLGISAWLHLKAPMTTELRPRA